MNRQLLVAGLSVGAAAHAQLYDRVEVKVDPSFWPMAGALLALVLIAAVGAVWLFRFRSAAREKKPDPA